MNVIRLISKTLLFIVFILPLNPFDSSILRLSFTGYPPLSFGSLYLPRIFRFTIRLYWFGQGVIHGPKVDSDLKSSSIGRKTYLDHLSRFSLVARSLSMCSCVWILDQQSWFQVPVLFLLSFVSKCTSR